MATPLTHDQWLTKLRAEGVTVTEYPGWRTRERDDETGKTFGSVRMFLNHHTAGRNSRDIVAKNGVAGLPGPLAHVHLAKSGVATMCSAGRTNHAGLMALNAYASFRDEEPIHPAPSRASGTVDGNDVAYGIETENLGDGQDEYPREQYDAWVRINAAVCRHHGWTADSCGGHLETSIEGKIDPRGPVEGYGNRGRFQFTMRQFRADVDERLAHRASWSPGSPTAPSEEDDMPSVKEIADEIETRLFRTDGKYKAPRDAADYNPDPASSRHWWSGQTWYEATVNAVRATEAKVDALAAKVDQLETTGLTEAQINALADRLLDKMSGRLTN